MDTRRWARSLILCGLLVGTMAVGACASRQQEQLMRSAMARLLPKNVDTFAKGYLKLIQDGSVDSAAALLVPSLLVPSARTEPANTNSILTPFPVDSAGVVGVNVSSSGSVVHTNVTYQLHIDSAWA